MKTSLPEDIESKMKLWRAGATWIPEEYILFHQKLAEKDLEDFPTRGIKVHSHWMADDGWMDGMKVLHAVIELSDETLLKIKWNDANQGWMSRFTGCGGWGIIHLEPAESC